MEEGGGGDGGERCWARERERGISMRVGEGWRREVVGIEEAMKVWLTRR